MDIPAIESAFTNALLGIIPFFGPALVDMTPEEKRAFLLQLAEVVSRGAAAGFAQGLQKNQGANT